MAAPILSLPVKVNSSNALVIVATASSVQPTVTGNSAPAPLPHLPVAVDSSNRLRVRII